MTVASVQNLFPAMTAPDAGQHLLHSVCQSLFPCHVTVNYGHMPYPKAQHLRAVRKNHDYTDVFARHCCADMQTALSIACCTAKPN